MRLNDHQHTEEALQTDSVLLTTLGLLLIPSPLVKNPKARASLPAPVGYFSLGFQISAIDHQWNFIDDTFEYVFSVLAEVGDISVLLRAGLRNHLKALVPFLLLEQTRKQRA